MILAINILL